MTNLNPECYQFQNWIQNPYSSGNNKFWIWYTVQFKIWIQNLTILKLTNPWFVWKLNLEALNLSSKVSTYRSMGILCIRYSLSDPPTPGFNIGWNTLHNNIRKLSRELYSTTKQGACLCVCVGGGILRYSEGKAKSKHFHGIQEWVQNSFHKRAINSLNLFD